MSGQNRIVPGLPFNNKLLEASERTGLVRMSCRDCDVYQVAAMNPDVKSLLKILL
jgi:hypothetical protein